jgi:hypothetical protein
LPLPTLLNFHFINLIHPINRNLNFRALGEPGTSETAQLKSHPKAPFFPFFSKSKINQKHLIPSIS